MWCLRLLADLVAVNYVFAHMKPHKGLHHCFFSSAYLLTLKIPFFALGCQMTASAGVILVSVTVPHWTAGGGTHDGTTLDSGGGGTSDGPTLDRRGRYQ